MTNCLKGHWCGGRRRGLEPFGKRRKEFGEAKGRKAERAGVSESNESLISPHLRYRIYAATPFIASIVYRISKISGTHVSVANGGPGASRSVLSVPFRLITFFTKRTQPQKNRIPNKINMNLKILCHNDTQNKPKHYRFIPPYALRKRVHPS